MSLRRHDDGRGELLPRKAGDFPKVGRGRAWQHHLDADAFGRKLVLQRMAERNDIGFGRAVHTVERLGRDPHHGRDVDDRARRPRNECRRGGISQAGERRNVDGDHLIRLVNLGIQQRRDRADAGIVDEHGDGLIIPQQAFHLREIRLVAEVGAQRGD